VLTGKQERKRKEQEQEGALSSEEEGNRRDIYAVCLHALCMFLDVCGCVGQCRYCLL